MVNKMKNSLKEIKKTKTKYYVKYTHNAFTFLHPDSYVN